MKLMHLFESLKLVNEGYKEATADFSIEADKETVTSVIDQYKELVKRNQVLGDERNIDYWRKQGWGKFNSFVETKSSKSSVTQIKRKKIAGNSITLQEDDNWLIVVPLDKDASCFHGKNSDWCTTKVNQSYFEEYFYNNEVVLIYCLNKTNAGMWAIAAHSKTDEIELFDQRDNSITSVQFKEQTGLNPAVLATNALSAEHKPTIDSVRGNYKEMMSRQNALISDMGYGKRSEEIEELLLKTKNDKSLIKYLKKVGAKEEVLPAIQLAAVKNDEYLIRYIKNPSEAVQLAAVKNDTYLIRYIKNPSEAAQLAAVKENGNAIQYIKNPSEAVQLAAVKENGNTIQYIKNPSEAVQLAAVKQDRYLIRYIKNPSEAVQLAAVKQDGMAIRFIENPSEQLQLIAVSNAGGAITYIKNPSEAVQLAAVKENGDAIHYIKNPSEAVQLAAVKQNGDAIQFIKNPTPKVIALAKQLKTGA